MVKIITSNISHEDLENKINEWDVSNRNIQNILFSANVLHEFYHTDPSTIANQWIEYTAIIIY